MSNQLPTQYQQFIHLSRYSRWLEDEGRRENWGETIERYFSFFEEHLQEMCNYKLDSKTKEELDEFMNKLYIENIWCFGKEKLDYFRHARKNTLEEFFI